MENFLNSYAFEQMTKEYNKKYNYNQGVEVLNKKEDERTMLKVKNAFDRVFHLFYLLNIRFGKEIRFKDFFVNVNDLKKDIKDFYITIYNKEYIEESIINNDKNINHKLCANKMLDTYSCFFDILSEEYKKVFLDKTGHDNAFFEGFSYIFGKFTKVLKIFYLEI
ncbi:MAG: hypothetical protein IJW32_01830 [Clostridia bacterium]|nr:hypothetical protein [Clostridia bacterium]